MTNDEKLSAVYENLTIFREFVESEDYRHMSSIRHEDKIIDNFLTDVILRYDTIKFFQDINIMHSRVLYESQVLAQIVCDFMGFE